MKKRQEPAAYKLKTINTDREFTKQELVEIDYALNRWEWDERLGPAPDGWDSMPYYLSTGEEARRRFSLRRRPATRRDAIRPVKREIEQHVSSYDSLKYLHMHEFGYTEQEFTEWYLGQLGNAVLRPWRGA